MGESEVQGATGMKVFIAIPTYLSRIEDASVLHSLLRASRHHTVNLGMMSSSANCLGFNKLWLDALELRPKGFTHFLMLHSDIVPEIYFVDKMVDIMQQTGMDIVSVVSPIKDEKGLTSIALDEQVGDVDPRWRVRRLTLKEIFKMPPTFTNDKLLINTGLMLVDIRKPWVDKIHFHFDDAIIEHHGRKLAVCFPEDWNFSRDARKLGAKMCATREVSITHMGPMQYPNSQPWGTWEIDAIPKDYRDVEEALFAMDKIEGWFTVDEATYLYRTAVRTTGPIVEIGSWKGRSTAVLGKAAQKTGNQVFAVDPHEGNVSDGPNTGKTLDEFMKNMIEAGVIDKVTPVVKRAADVNGEIPEEIGMVFIDGLHDYENVKADFNKFAPKVKKDGYVVFHDWSPQYPDIQRVVNEALMTMVDGKPWLQDAGSAGALKVLKVCS